MRALQAVSLPLIAVPLILFLKFSSTSASPLNPQLSQPQTQPKPLPAVLTNTFSNSAVTKDGNPVAASLTNANSNSAATKDGRPEPGLSSKDGSLDPASLTDADANSVDDKYGSLGIRILLMTRYRSGSSFLGNLFAHHPDIFYLPEPFQLLTVPRWNDPAGITFQKTYYALDPLYNCDFAPIYENSLQKQEPVQIWHRTFCSYSSHNFNEQSDLKAFCKNARSLTDPSDLPSYTSKVCEAYKHKVIKTIRLRNMNLLKHVIEDLNVKVIHNIRDPRGQLSSILSLRNIPNASIPTVRQWATSICDDLMASLDTAQRLIKETPALAENYLIVRYEDLALNTEKLTQRMYQFAKLDFHPDTQEWIKFSTTTSDKNSTYGVIRNSTDVVFAWTHKLSFAQVMAIQEPCHDVLVRLGYSLLYSPEALERNKHPMMDILDTFVKKRALRP